MKEDTTGQRRSTAVYKIAWIVPSTKSRSHLNEVMLPLPSFCTNKANK
jgi:hypothetical protein